MTAIALNYCYHPSLDQSFHDWAGQSRTEIVSKPWATSTPSSGSYYPAPLEVSAESGVTRWFADILSLQDEGHCPLTTPEVPAALAEIREAFSLNVVQLAQVFGVSRQAVYDWREGKPVKVENRQRIADIQNLAHRWNELYPKPMGRVVAEEIDGSSSLSLMSAERIDEAAITAHFHVIAKRLAAAEANRPPSAHELIEKHGMQPLSESEQRRNAWSFFLTGRRGR